ncbi:MAG: PAS domain-containing protein, partial [Pirellulales bacterium]|nr:PAS domain-containing protein [Pirellulales bacterium]
SSVVANELYVIVLFRIVCYGLRKSYSRTKRRAELKIGITPVNNDHSTSNLSTARQNENIKPSVSLAFLQTVIDAIPESILVIDLGYRVVLANQATREHVTAVNPFVEHLPCYQVSHHRDSPCQGDEFPCPLKEVLATKAPVTVVHTHLDSMGSEVFVEITASPIFNEAHEVVQIVESCRDITERKRIHRLLEIGNRHMAMKPMLDEFVKEIMDFAKCSAVGIRILDPEGRIDFHAQMGFNEENRDVQNSRSAQQSRCRCVEVILDQTDALQAPCTEGGSYFISSTTELPAYRSGDEKQPYCNMCSLLGFEAAALVPIRLGDRTIGLILVADRRKNAFSMKMVMELERMAMQLGTAIQRVRAEELLRAAHHELENRVQERTKELARINRDLEAQIQERRLLEQEVLDVSTREQQRIGQELHDGLGQELTGLGYLAKRLHHRLLAQASPEVQKAAELAQGIPGVINQIQRIVRNLVPMEIDRDGLLSALQALAANLEERSGISCLVESNRPVWIRDVDTAIHLYRIAQEVLNNAVKHGKPQRILLRLEAQDGQTTLRIHDDGLGIHHSGKRSAGSGLRIMQYRASVIGADLDVQSAPGGGTLVTCTLPWEEPND